MTLNGIDISHHNWSVIKIYGAAWLQKMARENFVIMKLTEGITFDDPKAAAYLAMIEEDDTAEPPAIGFYHYARPEYNTPEDEAKHFLRQLKNVYEYKRGAVLALDVEGRALSVKGLDNWCWTWCDYVYRMTGVKPMIYLQKAALKQLPRCATSDFGLWVASWSDTKPRKVQPWPFVAIWQYSSLGLDKDYFFGDREAWFKYAGVNYNGKFTYQ